MVVSEGTSFKRNRVTIARAETMLELFCILGADGWELCGIASESEVPDRFYFKYFSPTWEKSSGG